MFEVLFEVLNLIVAHAYLFSIKVLKIDPKTNKCINYPDKLNTPLQ
jgi:hypothetical protein